MDDFPLWLDEEEVRALAEEISERLDRAPYPDVETLAAPLFAFGARLRLEANGEDGLEARGA
jgi:hypothetical protein